MTTGKAGRTRCARNGQAEIAFEDLGGSGGDPVLLLMGMAVSRFWWPQGFVRELIGCGFHVVAFDQRDAGESTRFRDERKGSPVISLLFRKRSAAYDAEDMTDDAVAVLDALGWDSAHLFGVSMGGLLAQRVALRHPERVRSITSMAAQPSDAGRLATARYIHFGLLARLARLRYPADQDGDVALGLALARALASPGYPFDEAEARDWIGRDVTSGVRDVGAQRRQAGAKWHGGKLAELRMPALVLHGGADPLLRQAASRDTAAAIEGARLVILPGVGHELPRAVWPQVAGELRALADRADAAAGKTSRLSGMPRSGARYTAGRAGIRHNWNSGPPRMRTFPSPSARRCSPDRWISAAKSSRPAASLPSTGLRSSPLLTWPDGDLQSVSDPAGGRREGLSGPDAEGPARSSRSRAGPSSTCACVNC